MSANVMTPERPAVQSPRAGFVHVLRAEWTKFRTVRGWVVWMVLAAVLIDLVGLFAGGQANIACGNGRTGSACMVSPPIGPGGEAVTDSFYFVHQPLASQGSVTARVTSLTGRYGGKGVQAAGQGPAGMTPGVQPWSKAGIIIKASTTQGSAYAAMLVTGSHGVRFQYDYTQDIAGLPGKISGASPRWLRLTRSGDTVTGYDSADGSHWTEVGAASLPGLPATVQAGLFATSPVYTKITPFFGGDSGQVGPSLTTGAFDSVHLSDGQATGRWAGSDIGPNGPDLTGPPIGFHQAGGRFTVTGSGDIAPLVQGTGAGGPTGTIEDHLAGTFAGLIAVVVIAAAFMTAEYRRGLIRTTLAASPRRGQVLAAKALVLALLAFVAGVVAAVIAVFAGVRMAHSEGIYVLPVTWLTQARVIVGTGALLAVAAVLAVAIGALVRRSAVAVAAVIVGIVLPYVLGVARFLPIAAAEWLLRVTPAAAFAIQQSTPQYPQVLDQYTPPQFFPLSPWAGFAVLCGYAALALALALYLLRRRDA